VKHEDDPFDLEKLRLRPEADENWAVVPLKIRRRRRHFVKVPWAWVEKLAEARYISTYRVALHVLYRDWETHGEAFTLSNGALAMEGVSRRQKWRALEELEGLGLISIERRRRKTPRITVANLR
jgi:hypothetical protein